MSYKHIKKGFNISDAAYSNLPDSRKKYYEQNLVGNFHRTAHSFAARKITPTTEYESPRHEESPSLIDNVVEGLAIGVGIGLLQDFFDGHSEGSISSSQADTPDVTASDITETQFGGGDFGGAGSGAEW